MAKPEGSLIIVTGLPAAGKSCVAAALVAGYLGMEQGVQPADFNQYGARRPSPPQSVRHDGVTIFSDGAIEHDPSMPAAPLEAIAAAAALTRVPSATLLRQARSPLCQNALHTATGVACNELCYLALIMARRPEANIPTFDAIRAFIRRALWQLDYWNNGPTSVVPFQNPGDRRDDLSVWGYEIVTNPTTAVEEWRFAERVWICKPQLCA